MQSLKDAILRIENRKHKGIMLSSSERDFLIQLRKMLDKLDSQQG